MIQRETTAKAQADVFKAQLLKLTHHVAMWKVSEIEQ